MRELVRSLPTSKLVQAIAHEPSLARLAIRIGIPESLDRRLIEIYAPSMAALHDALCAELDARVPPVETRQ